MFDQPGFHPATPDALAEFLLSARDRAIAAAPAFDEAVAGALMTLLRRLGTRCVVVMDLDERVHRLGYGSPRPETLRALQANAEEAGTAIRHEPGLRCCVYIADDRCLIAAPIAKCGEADPSERGAVNAFAIRPVPAEILRAFDRSSSRAHRVLGERAIADEDVDRVSRSLELTPARPFDLSRIENVYRTHIVFVEMKLVDTQLHRKKVTVPEEIFASIPDRGVRERLAAQYKLFDPADLPLLSGKHLKARADEVRRRFLSPIHDHGSILRQDRRREFEAAVEALQRDIEGFRLAVEAQIEVLQRQAIERLRDAIVATARNALPPDSSQHHGLPWHPAHPSYPDHIGQRISGTVERSVRDSVRGMALKVNFKDVTYETLKDPTFREMAFEVLGDLPDLLDEHDAVSVDDLDEGSGPRSPRVPEQRNLF